MKRISRLKKSLRELLPKIIKWLYDLDQKLSEEKIPNPGNYRDLTPVYDADSSGKYSEAILWAIQNKNIKNIALTGPYGSGKSSILRTFQTKNKQFEYLNISLASFDDLSSVEKVRKEAIEQSILQQLFYHEKNNSIPDSRFKKIRKFTRRQQIKSSIYILAWLICAIILFFSNKLSEWLGWEVTTRFEPTLITIAIFSIFTAGCFAFIFKTSRILRNLKLSKFKAYDAEIELNSSTGASILNQHLEEIIYFFEVTQYDVIVIEDLDRFNNTEIFVTLRELNTLINNSKQIGRIIKFIYAVKDDLFHAGKYERSKFFDFIIPVIPIINTSNNQDLFASLLSNVEFDSTQNSGFINEVSFYIDDMRMLINIANEYSLYRAVLPNDLNETKLIAIIIYKNCYPEDFAQLHSNSGILFQIFDKKSYIVDAAIQKNQNEIDLLEEQLLNMAKIQARNVYDLNAGYLAKLLEAAPNNSSVNLYYKNNNHHISDFLSGDIFRNAQQDSRFSNSNNQFVKTFKDLEKEVDPDFSYNERLALLNSKNDNQQETLKSKIEVLAKTITDTRLFSIAEAIEYLGVKKIESLILPSTYEGEDYLTKNTLLIYLVRNGYIDERYDLYLSHFYPGSITENDRKFILNVLSLQDNSFEARLDNPSHVIKQILQRHFKNSTVLNITLVNHIVSTEAINKDKYELLLDQLSDNSATSKNFIDSYFSRGMHANKFIKDLVVHWDGLSTWVFKESNFTRERQADYFRTILSESDFQGIRNQNADQVVTNYIAETILLKELLGENISEEILTKFTEWIRRLDVKFYHIKDLLEYDAIAKTVCDHDLYAINEWMISVMMTSSIFNKEELNMKNYTTIKEKGPEKLIKYVDENIKEYSERVLYGMDSSIEEEEQFLTEILNNKDIDNGIKEMILVRQKNKLEDIKDIMVELLPTTIRNNKASATWNNVLIYHQHFGLDENLIAFINEEQNFPTLFLQEIDDEFKSGFSSYTNLEALFSGILLSSNISEAAYKAFLKVYGYEIDDEQNLESLSKQKVEALIDTLTLRGSAFYFNFLKNNFQGFHLRLLESNPSAIKELNESYAIEESDYLALFKSQKLNKTGKHNLVQVLATRTDLSKQLANALTEYIIKYPKLVLIDAVKSNLSTFFKDNESKSSMLDIFVSGSEKVSEIEQLLEALGNPFSEFANDEDNFSIKNSDQQLKILKILKGKYVQDWKIEEDSIIVEKLVRE